MSEEEDSHRAFRALLDALAAPGRWRRTPAADAEGALELLRMAVWEDDVSVVVSGARDVAAVIGSAGVGTEEEPERGATVVVLADGSDESRVMMTGPGIANELVVQLPLGPAALEARRGACAGYPLGVDIVFVDAEGRLLGLPRTTILTGPR